MQLSPIELAVLDACRRRWQTASELVALMEEQNGTAVTYQEFAGVIMWLEILGLLTSEALTGGERLYHPTSHGAAYLLKSVSAG